MLLTLEQSHNVRDAITTETERLVREMYAELSRWAHEQATRAATWSGVSGELQEQYLKELGDQLYAASQGALDGLGPVAVGGMETISQSVVQEIGNTFLGMDTSYSHIPTQAIASVLNGTIYPPRADGSKWTFSQAIWGADQQARSDIDRIIAEGLAKNLPTWDIAKQLEAYVSPGASKDFNWGNIVEGRTESEKTIDYNAQRLARTMIQHAFQQSLVMSTEHNPFVTGYIWHSAFTERTCAECEALDGMHFDKGTLPYDHPNGLCYFVVDTVSNEEMIDRLANWVNGAEDAELDRYAADMIGRHGLAQPREVNRGKGYIELGMKEAHDLSSAQIKELMNLSGMDRQQLKDFVSVYVGNSRGPEMNQILRETGSIENAITYLQQMIDQALAQHPNEPWLANPYQERTMLDFLQKFQQFIPGTTGLPEDIELHRQTDGSFLDFLMRQLGVTTNYSDVGVGGATPGMATELSRLIGVTYTDLGFVSTSWANSGHGGMSDGTKFWEMPVQLTLNTPQGTQVLYTDQLLRDKQGEIILPPGMQYQITDIRYIDQASVPYLEPGNAKEVSWGDKYNFIEIIITVI